MNFALWIVVAILTLLNVATLATFAGYLRRLLCYRTANVREADLPEVAVILSLRGGNGTLQKALDRLAAQKYPRYRLYIVVDHPGDPAWPIVKRWQATCDAIPIEVEFLRTRLPYCTLKFSAVRQVLARLPAEIGAVAVIDADADAYASWLRDLVAPLTQANVAAVTGNRWYFPRHGGIGGWCRFIFTGCSLPYMEAVGHAWGGSLAMRREFVDSRAFLDACERGRASTEEEAVYEALRASRQKIVVSPHVMLWNPEETSLERSFRHLVRQSIWDRLYIPMWTTILGYLIATCLALGIAAYAGLDSLFIGPRRPAAEWALLSALAYWGIVVSSLVAVHAVLRRRIMPRQGRMLPPLTPRRLLEMALSAPPALILSAGAVLVAHFTRTIEWSGVRYDVAPDSSIRLAAYRPAADGKRPAERPAGQVDPRLA